MLQSIYINNLFGLYSYNIDFGNRQDWNIKFITAPNGYGKTTILDIINDIYNEDFESLSKIPFDELSLKLDDNELRISQNKKVPDTDIDSDVMDEVSVTLHITFVNGRRSDTSISCDWTKDSGELTILPLHLYLSSHPIYYIRDQRVAYTMDVSRVKRDAESFATLLRNEKYLVSTQFTTSQSSVTTPIDKGDYEEERDKMTDVLNLLFKSGLYTKIDLDEYSEDNAIFLHIVSDAIGKIVTDSGKFLAKLKSFFDIIEHSRFSNKQLQVSPAYGFRFIAKNADGTILDADVLSSGEKQILIMTIELLFMSDDSSIVLVDEPEISFHMAWQSQFLQNIKEIAILKKLQCVISTHSPAIFRNRWELSTDLYRITHPVK